MLEVDVRALMLMRGTGAGKTTLIDALAGRSAHTVHGDVFVTDEQGESISVFSRSVRDAVAR